jgi:hypothetical protein
MPRVFDSKGHELVVGAVLVRVSAAGVTCTLRGVCTHVEREQVDVVFTTKVVSLPVQRSGFFRRSYTCPDLQIIDSPSERKG